MNIAEIIRRLRALIHCGGLTVAGVNVLSDAIETIEELSSKLCESHVKYEMCKPRMYSVEENGLPDKSGEYVIKTKHGSFYTVSYSSKYKAFNVKDEYDESRLAWQMEADYWFPVSLFITED